MMFQQRICLAFSLSPMKKCYNSHSGSMWAISMSLPWLLLYFPFVANQLYCYFRMAGLTFNKKMQGQLCARKFSCFCIFFSNVSTEQTLRHFKPPEEKNKTIICTWLHLTFSLVYQYTYTSSPQLVRRWCLRQWQAVEQASLPHGWRTTHSSTTSWPTGLR